MIRRWTLTLACAASLFVMPPAHAQPPSHQAPPPRFEDPDRRARLARAFPEIDQIFETYLRDAFVPGAAWAVLIDGEVAHSGTYGVQAIDGAPVTLDTVFRIASMTKSFTALAILKLRDEGRLLLDDPAERYVPELRDLAYPTADSPRITIRHLLSHAAGFPEDNPWGDQQLHISDAEMTELLRRGIPFSNPPGIGYEYSNFGFAILGRIVTVVSGTSYADYVGEHILHPLGMSATTLDPSAVPTSHLALGYRREDETWTLEPALADGAFGAMGGMLASTRDLVRYVGYLMAAWPPRDAGDSGPVGRASLREMQQVWRPRPASVTKAADGALQLFAGGYGYGLRVSQSCAVSHVVGHAGGLPGYGSLMLWLPEHGVGIVAAGNLTYTSWGPRFDAAFDALMRTGALKRREPQPSPALTAAREAVSRLVVDWNDELAEGIAAENLFLDRSKARRREEFAVIRARHGVCRDDSRLDVENALRGQWTMPCERGAVRVTITLAPTVPPRVQHLAVVSFAQDAPTPASSCPILE